MLSLYCDSRSRAQETQGGSRRLCTRPACCQRSLGVASGLWTPGPPLQSGVQRPDPEEKTERHEVDFKHLIWPLPANHAPPTPSPGRLSKAPFGGMSCTSDDGNPKTTTGQQHWILSGPFLSFLSFLSLCLCACALLVAGGRRPSLPRPATSGGGGLLRWAPSRLPPPPPCSCPPPSFAALGFFWGGGGLLAQHPKDVASVCEKQRQKFDGRTKTPLPHPSRDQSS